MSFLPGTWLIFSLSFARGNYREFLTRWRVLLAAAFVGPVGLAVFFSRRLILAPGPAELDRQVFGLSGYGTALYLLFLISAVLVLMNLERTFRASVGTMRWRIKFMVMGVGVLFAVRAYTSSQCLLFHAVNPSLQTVNAIGLLVAGLLILRWLLRAGHFNVNVYPSHAVLHNSLTVMLAGIYLLIVGLLAKVVTLLGGAAAFPLKSFFVLVSLVGLTAVLLSDRMRLHTRRFVSRHFRRPHYDYRAVWRSFAKGTAKCVEQRDLCAAVVKLTSEVFQSLSVTIWLIDERQEKLTFAASTSLSEPQAGQLKLEAAEAAPVIAALSNHPDPINIDAVNEIWAVHLRRLHPGEFRKGGDRICVPLMAGGQMLGVLALGDRVGGVPFSLQDFHLLKSVSDEVAAGLLNIQLSQRLSQAKQLEGFQAMSTFFVHDLKNSTSTLSLMLQNLPLHFHEPRFREDALRGISNTVKHINGLIGRLSLLRQDLTLRTIESDLNELVAEALKRLPGLSGVELVKELRPLPKVLVDPAQIQTVITNLVLNAKEALGSAGQIRVETSRRNGWVILAVADNGSGMSAKFIERSLFRPFQTTKKAGIGIGMFQCKMMVEAHRGRIEVDSEPGKGTAFRVLLPVTGGPGKAE